MSHLLRTGRWRRRMPGGGGRHFGCGHTTASARSGSYCTRSTTTIRCGARHVALVAYEPRSCAALPVVSHGTIGGKASLHRLSQLSCSALLVTRTPLTGCKRVQLRGIDADPEVFISAAQVHPRAAGAVPGAGAPGGARPPAGVRRRSLLAPRRPPGGASLLCRGSALQEALQTLPATASAVRTAGRQMLHAVASAAAPPAHGLNGCLSAAVQTAALTDWRAGFHLFGYNDKTPWSADGRLMLGLRTALSPRDLGPGDSAQIGLIPFAKGARLHAFLPCAAVLSSPIYQPGRACAPRCHYATWALASAVQIGLIPFAKRCALICVCSIQGVHVIAVSSTSVCRRWALCARLGSCIQCSAWKTVLLGASACRTHHLHLPTGARKKAHRLWHKAETCNAVAPAGKPVSQDRAGWSWEPLATTTAWNFHIGACTLGFRVLVVSRLLGGLRCTLRRLERGTKHQKLVQQLCCAAHPTPGKTAALDRIGVYTFVAWKGSMKASTWRGLLAAACRRQCAVGGPLQPAGGVQCARLPTGRLWRRAVRHRDRCDQQVRHPVSPPPAPVSKFRPALVARNKHYLGFRICGHARKRATKATCRLFGGPHLASLRCAGGGCGCYRGPFSTSARTALWPPPWTSFASTVAAPVSCVTMP